MADIGNVEVTRPLDRVVHGSTSFLTFVEIVKRSNSCTFSSATRDLFCSAKYEFFKQFDRNGGYFKFLLGFIYILVGFKNLKCIVIICHCLVIPVRQKQRYFDMLLIFNSDCPMPIFYSDVTAWKHGIDCLPIFPKHSR